MLTLDGLPAWTISPLRDALQTQGVPRAAITDSGEIDGVLLATVLIDTVKIRTNVTPELTLDLREVASGPPSPVTQALQPTLTFKGRLGERTIAPYGESTAGGLVFAGLLAGAAALVIRHLRRRRKSPTV